MSLRAIRLWPDPCLSAMCAEIDPLASETARLTDDLLETMYHAKGRGLAAPQVGVLARAFVVDVMWKDGAPSPMVFLNPVITEVGADFVEMNEQCLSIPALPMSVARPDRITVAWTDLNGQNRSASFDGALARCIQHELDHLNGTVIFDHQSAKDRVELERAYAS
jgi:peptide deformylase